LISWSEKGTSFIVHDRQGFYRQVLTQCAASHCLWQDFTSILNRHSIYKNKENRSQSEFRSKLLVRGRPDLAAQIESNRFNNRKNRPTEKLVDHTNLPSNRTESVKRIRTGSLTVRIHQSTKSQNHKVYNSSKVDPLRALNRITTKDFRLDFHEGFPMALYTLLEEAARHNEKYNGTGLAEILGWLPSGLAFEVRRPNLMEQLLKRCMKGSFHNGKRYTVFQDILSRFEFESTKDGKLSGWSNDLFRRGGRDAVEWLQARAPPPMPLDDKSRSKAL
jgi:hypothetical protein